METQKTYTNKCHIDENVTYVWNSQINRNGGDSGNRTENNNALMKMPPIFISAIQKANKDLISDRTIKQFICASLKIDFKEEYMHFGFLAMTTPTPTTAKADTTTPKAKEWINRLNTALESAKKKSVYPSGTELRKQILKIVPKEQQKEVLKHFIKVPEVKTEFSFE